MRTLFKDEKLFVVSPRSLCRLVIACALIIQTQQAISCSLATGYFYQVTRLRGIVVGMDNYWPLLGYRSYPRWLRHRFVRPNVTLRLYEYRSHWNLSRSHTVATVRTDESGNFDLGVVHEGHYTLLIDWPAGYSNQFDVEVKRLPAETSSVKIDVSPVNPDCTGGHEFISYSK